jgi:ABC-2 family transporter protein
MLALLVVLGLLYPVAAMISYITREKEQGQKELMKMMSAAESDIGWSWFVSFLSFNIVTATIVSAVSMALFAKSEGLLLWMFWILFFLALTVFCMFLATLTSKTTRAVVVGLLM